MKTTCSSPSPGRRVGDRDVWRVEGLGRQAFRSSVARCARRQRAEGALQAAGGCLDRATFALAQLAFWPLAVGRGPLVAGHTKNFSIRHRRGGRFHLAPLYGVLSAWPIIGRGANQLSYQRAKLAMALGDQNALPAGRDPCEALAAPGRFVRPGRGRSNDSHGRTGRQAAAGPGASFASGLSEPRLVARYRRHATPACAVPAVCGVNMAPFSRRRNNGCCPR